MTRAACAIGTITVLALSSGLALPGGVRAAQAMPPLRVCADPNNLPFSNQRREGFENRLAEMLARDLRRPLAYEWWPQRRGFVRMTLRSGACDVIMGVPSAFELALTTRPYYRSAYGFLTRSSLTPPISSFDDSRLRHLRIGVQMIGDDFANSPPAHALSARGVIANIVGFSVLGNYREANPPARIVDAVSKGEIDTAVVWGPLAGYFAARSRVPLRWTAVSPEIDPPFLPFAFDISMAVRREDEALHDRLDEFISRRQSDINHLLDEYHVPRIGRSARR